ncbi:MAG: hypothetical protein EOP04_13630 [Proteobacteria bacterium]|nr:MAG: hypothetical protein EOP04_13630 [Pseudomonadota bacterium]
MKHFITAFLILFAVSAGARSPGDSPTPFPLGQAPEDMVGQWNNLDKDEKIVIMFIRNGQIEKAKLLASVFAGGRKTSQGYLIFNGEAYCGVMKKTRGGKYNLCVWKEDNLLQTATYTDGEWGAYRSYK